MMEAVIVCSGRITEGLIESILSDNLPSGPKGHVDFAAFTARLKSCPDTKRLFEQRSMSFSATCKALTYESCPFKTSTLSELSKPSQFHSLTGNRGEGGTLRNWIDGILSTIPLFPEREKSMVFP
jgi:hypothetical protein